MSRTITFNERQGGDVKYHHFCTNESKLYFNKEAEAYKQQGFNHPGSEVSRLKFRTIQ